MAPPSSNSSDGGEQCIVNDQMGPFTVLYTLVFIISVPGNLLSVWIFIRSRRVKRSLSVYLLNLLLSDLLLLLALPFKILKDGGAAPWSLKVFHCQASAVTLYISLYASIAFLAFIITDCYLQDCTSLRSMWLQGVGFSWLVSVVVWMLLLLIMVPNMALPIQHVQEQRFLSCSSLKKGISLHWHALTVVLCTALFLNASFSVLLSSFLALRRLLGSCRDPLLRADARRAAVSVTAVALAYIVGFVPYHVVRAPYTLTQTKVITECSVRRKLFLGKEATLLLSVLHLCFDPLIFYYLHEPFRQTVSNMMPCWRKKRSEEEEEEEEEGKAAEEEAAEGKATVEQDLQTTLI
ncbi:probable G-protein coupled receptor 171 isoform X2 [Trematomus bernacchii]|uniref:probable G-protein coupled receptor 171 isoform X2 n=1 Tax=Trematomus bernacchii TaxID=40690 RepID=UPI00146D38DD|nr:probable G-protein coupled receptor 171 isoform X2 [Trematomus bernacchii]